MNNAPIGTIMPYPIDLHTSLTLPSGWQLCGGLDGRPNLNSENRFIRGTNGNTGNVGGSNSHRHGSDYSNYGGGTAGPNTVTSTDVCIPPHYTIVWIIKTTEEN